MRPHGHSLAPSRELLVPAGQREQGAALPGSRLGPLGGQHRADGSGLGRVGVDCQCRSEHFTPLKFLFVVPVLELQVLGRHRGFQLVLAVFLTILTSRADPERVREEKLLCGCGGSGVFAAHVGWLGKKRGSSQPMELV